MQRTSYTIARIFAFVISALLAYLLWTILRPRFVQQPIEQADQIVLKAPEDMIKPSDENITITRESAPAIKEVSSEKHPTKEVLEKKAQSAIKSLVEKTTPVVQEKPKTPSTKQPITSIQQIRSITVQNGIVKKMLGYKKFGTHYPTNFKIRIDNKVLSEGESLSTTIQNNTLVARFDFEFMNGYRNGGKEVTMTLKPEVEAITLSFNWKGEHHLFAEAEKVVSIVEKNVPYQA